MLRCILPLILVLCMCHYSNAQISVQLNAADRIIACPVAPAAAVACTAHFVISGCMAARIAAPGITVYDVATGSAFPGVDYSISATTYAVGNLSGSLAYTITYPTPLSNDDKTINLRIKLDLVDTVMWFNDAITIKGANVTPKPGFSMPDTVNVGFNLLTAGSLDFFDGTQFTKYMGELEIKMPHLAGIKMLGLKGVPFGIFTGIYNYNYFSADSSGSHLHNELRQITPNDTIRIGAKYVSATNRILSKTTNKVWGYYLQPNFRLGDPANYNATTGVYLTLHAEALVSNVRTDFSETNNHTDTLVFYRHRFS